MSASEQYPTTVASAADLVMSRLSDELKTWMQLFDGDEIDLQIQLAAMMTPGINVRAMLGLWEQNPKLLHRLPRQYRILTPPRLTSWSNAGGGYAPT